MKATYSLDEETVRELEARPRLPDERAEEWAGRVRGACLSSERVQRKRPGGST